MKKNNRLGFFLALMSYVLWGFLALFWHLFAGMNALEIFSYRILSTLLTMLLYFVLTRRLTKLKDELSGLIKVKHGLLSALTAAVLIAVNWLVYIYAIASNQATDASLGYYIMPLLSVLLAVVFLHEKMNRLAQVAILIAAVAVLFMTIENGKFPLIALALAFSFGFYGLVKKNIVLSSDVSITFETLVIAPFALLYLLFIAKHNPLSYSVPDQFYLLFSGIITAIPLLLFAESLKHTDLGTVGFLQYVNPTLQLLIALLIFKESVSIAGWESLALILLSILIFIIGQLKKA